MANHGDWPVTVRSVAVVHTIAVDGELRMFRHGYQSWSQTNLVHPGVDVDPSSVNTIELYTMMHHADQRTTTPEQLRSELVTVLADDADAVLIGFLGGDQHDGTIRLGRDAPGSRSRSRRSSDPQSSRRRGPGVARRGDPSDRRPGCGVDVWAADCGARSNARVDSAHVVGWCSWYHYFDRVREEDLRANLAAAEGWPFDLVQLDDGYQSAVGDWLTTNEKFPSGLAGVADAVRATGRRAGLWSRRSVWRRTRTGRRTPGLDRTTSRRVAADRHVR